MKIILTKKEIEEIILDYVCETVAEEFNNVRISDYSADYCVVTYVEPTPEEKWENIKKEFGLQA